MPPNGVWTDLISDFLSLTEGEWSPDIFRLWGAIAMIAGALERRVWVKAVRGRLTYPNLYNLLVAAPGVGKQVIDDVQDLWKETKDPSGTLVFKVAPDQMTKASLIDTLGRSKQVRLPPAGSPVIYHSLLIAAEEFEVLLPAYDKEYISSLNRIFNNPNSYSEVRRTGSVRDLSIEHPQLNILAGAQPAYFTSTFPEDAWSTGFARRIIMVYSNTTPYQDLFWEPPVVPQAREHLLARLGQISQLYGQLAWTKPAAEAIFQWHRDGEKPLPTHSKLEHYNRSRMMHVLKLCIVSAISSTGTKVIDLPDVERAIAWLCEAEALMPDIFREMVGRSDIQVIEEMHRFVMSAWARNRQKPIFGEAIARFLAQRLPSEKVQRVFELAERANFIARVAGTDDAWIPRPKHEQGME